MLERLQVIAMAADLIGAKTRGFVQNLSVNMEGDQVVLRGTSKTYWGKQMATQAALQVFTDEVGLTLVNDIEVLDYEPQSVL